MRLTWILGNLHYWNLGHHILPVMFHHMLSLEEPDTDVERIWD